VLSVLLAATPSPSPSAGPADDAVTPGVVGFLAILFVAVVTILLIVDMIRRIRRVRYRGEADERRAAAEAADRQQRRP
jgi:cytochrome bd-type quinol oxidase subunit 1